MIDVYCNECNQEELTKERKTKVLEACTNLSEFYASACSVFQDWLNEYSYYMDTTLFSKAMDLYHQITYYYKEYAESCNDALAGKMTVDEFKQDWIRRREVLINHYNKLVVAISNKVKSDSNIT